MDSKQTVQEDIIKFVEETCKEIDSKGDISKKFLEVSCVVKSDMCMYFIKSCIICFVYGLIRH